jgi:hypothetical protein
MKKFYTILLFISVTTLGFSQNATYTKYGLRTGMNISNLDFEPSPVTINQHRNGLYFGGFVEVPLSDKTFLNTEIQWSAQGAKDEAFRADYINLPIQLRFAVGDRFTFGAGPQIGLKTWEDNDAFETWSFSGVGGVEYMFLDDFFIDVRAVYGFSNILNDATGLEATDFTIQVGVGIKI